ncbi:small ribosomal subunit biogenesis GTPase RsgA [Agaribacter marinus]|uniref:Small ribosomal subunit biogenesis GTPase RsgA n=1 Tax=Agaribacter marinus TaxID=1431249 RepID=A0AA37WJT6_9ALTE|nr:small ribosomal subunit biogenesis GTPase RsgA [Agaribacter marinus]GLR72527.1 putative ribosome biogenesis GTPase RsgA [Agaribacter marinus]
MAKKPKLSKNQKRRVQQNRHKRIANQNEQTLDNLGEQIGGRVISRFGKHAIVESTDEKKQVHNCFIRRTVESVVCGDQVLFRPSISNEERDRGIIEAVLDRKSVLTRPDYYDGVKPIAANIDQIMVVSSILPAFSSHIIDRYLVACEQAKIEPIILVNKIELLDEKELCKLDKQLDIYRHLGYKVFLVSCKTHIGISSFVDELSDKVSVFVGQSGVGKSSLVNQLLPDAKEQVGDVSENSGLGQHTTTAAKLLHFSNGGELIDSPGVREFGLWHLSKEEVTTGFIEFRRYLGGCKFSDCSHKSDPGCLITDAVNTGDIEESRYQSYLKIIETLDTQRPSYAKS